MTQLDPDEYDAMEVAVLELLGQLVVAFERIAEAQERSAAASERAAAATERSTAAMEESTKIHARVLLRD